MERHRLYPKPTQAPVEESDQRAFERAFKPADKIEQMFCDDTAHADARAKRLRDWQDALIATKLREGLFNILRDIPLGLSEAEYLVENWSRGVPEAKAKVSAILAGVGLNEISIEAEAFQLCAASFVTLDRLQGSQAGRRDRGLVGLALYREMKRRQPDGGRKVVEGQQKKVVRLTQPPADNDK